MLVGLYEVVEFFGIRGDHGLWLDGWSHDQLEGNRTAVHKFGRSIETGKFGRTVIRRMMKMPSSESD